MSVCLRGSLGSGSDFYRSAAARAVGVSRPLHRVGSSIWMEEQTASTSAKWCSSTGQRLEEASSQGSMPSGIDLLTIMTARSLRDPDCHSGNWGGVRPWSRPLMADQGPNVADDRALDEEAGKENKIAVDGWCLNVCKGQKDQTHGVQGTERPHFRRHSSRVQRWHQIGILLINHHPNHFQDYLSPWGPNTLGACRWRHYHAKLSTESAKRGPVKHDKSTQLLLARPRVRAVKVAAKQPEEESLNARSRGFILEGSRHLPDKFVHQGSKGGGRRLVRHDGVLEGFQEGALPAGGGTLLSAGPPGCARCTA